MLKYFFPTSDLERDWAHTAPARFLFRVFLRGAATMALILSGLDAIRPRSVFDERPGSRLGFIVLWSLIMAALNLLAARHMKPRRAQL
jgi:hypothetical protein